MTKKIINNQPNMHSLDLGTKNIEQDANGTAGEWVAEFGETQYDAGASLERVRSFRLDPNNINYPERME
jgi:hypothetical protein